MHVNRKLSMLSAKQTTRRDLFHRQSGATRRLQPVGKSGGDAYLLITNFVIIYPTDHSAASIQHRGTGGLKRKPVPG